MDLVVFVAAIALISLLWWRIGFKPSDGVVRGLGRAFGFWRADGWPRGVQEEDPDRPWGSGKAEPRIVVVSPVVPRR
jgi:hypothetical protein